MIKKTPPIAEPGSEDADELLAERIVEEAGKAVRAAIREHKLLGHSISVWKDGRVVIIPPDQIED
jgi:hypothetical protein